MSRDPFNFEDLLDQDSIKQLFILATCTVIFSTSYLVLVSILTNNNFDFLDKFNESINFFSHSIESFLIILFLICLVIFLAWLCIIIIFKKISNGNNRLMSSMIFALWVSILITLIIKDFNIIVAGATVVLVIVTGYNVTQTRLNEEKRLEAEIEPGLNILSPLCENDQNDLNSADFYIENRGKGAAKKIKFWLEIKNEENFKAIKESFHINNLDIYYLPPGEKILIFNLNFEHLVRLIKNQTKNVKDNIELDEIIKSLQTEIVITYTNSKDKEQTPLRIPLDLSRFGGINAHIIGLQITTNPDAVPGILRLID